MKEAFKIGFLVISLLIAGVTTCKQCVGDEGLQPINSKGLVSFHPSLSPYVIYRQTRDECGTLSNFVERISIYQETYDSRPQFFYFKTKGDCKGEKAIEKSQIPQRSLRGCSIGIREYTKSTLNELAKMKMNPSMNDKPKKYLYTLATNNGTAFMKFETDEKGKGFDYLKYRIEKKCGE